jgi:hypothetical protein
MLPLVLTAAYAAVEFAGGLWSGSLALLGDAGHMASDAVALGVAAVAASDAMWPASPSSASEPDHRPPANSTAAYAAVSTSGNMNRGPRSSCECEWA